MMSNDGSCSSNSSWVGKGMSASSSFDANEMSSWVRRMKKEMRSTFGFCLSIPRRARTSQLGWPATWRTRILSRMTRSTNESVLFSATASSLATGVAIS